jgi:transposase-like protein
MKACSICTHKDRLAIDREVVQGNSLASIARKYEVEYHALFSHANKHISRQLVQVAEKKLMIESEGLMDLIKSIIERAEDIFTRNYTAGKDLTALKALSTQKDTIQLLSNISAQLHAAKIAEIQLQKELSGDGKEEEERKFAENIKILTTEELLVFQRISNKIEHQNNDLIINNSRVLVINQRLA